MNAKRVASVAAAGAAAWTQMYRLGRTWGSTSEERHRYLPGDGLVEDAPLVTNHATTIQASADEVWPWLVQVGWHRGGWYTYRWVDRLLFPGNDPSADEIVARYQDLRVGDRIRDGPPGSGCFFQVEALEPNKYLVLRSWTHLPPNLRKDPRNSMEWTWGFYLEEANENATRFIFRVRGNLRPAWLRLAYHLLVVPADFIMGRSMCQGLKGRVEQNVELQRRAAPGHAIRSRSTRDAALIQGVAVRSRGVRDRPAAIRPHWRSAAARRG